MNAWCEPPCLVLVAAMARRRSLPCSGLCHLAGPEAESRGEVYCAADDRFQAGRIFAEMAAIIERVPWLDDRVSIKRFTKELEDVGGNESIYAALSRESGTKMGMAPSS